MTQNNALFTPLSTEESVTVQGGWGCRRFRPYYYYSRPAFSSSRFGYGYGYGYSGGRRGSNNAIAQTTNINVIYQD